MFTKQFRITAALLALVAMTPLPASAGQVLRKAEPLKIQGPVYLTAGPTDFFGKDGTPLTLVIANNTDIPVPPGTTIYWSIKHRQPTNPTRWMETKGSLTAGLGLSGQPWRPWPIPPLEGPYTTKVWYLPWTVPK